MCVCVYPYQTRAQQGKDEEKRAKNENVKKEGSPPPLFLSLSLRVFFSSFQNFPSSFEVFFKKNQPPHTSKNDTANNAFRSRLRIVLYIVNTIRRQAQQHFFELLAVEELSARERKIMRYLTIKIPKTPKDFFYSSSSSIEKKTTKTTKEEEEEEDKEEEFEEIPPEELEKARIGLYVPERKRETMAFLSRAAKEKRSAIERQGFAKELEKEEQKIDEKSMLLGTTELRMKTINNKEMFPGEDLPVEKTTRAMEKKREEVFRDLELPYLPGTQTENTVRNVLETETRRFERDLRRDENGENEEDDDDDDEEHDGKKIRRQTHFFSRAEREQLYELPAETLAKLDCVENLLRTIHVHPPTQREFDCFAGGAGMREKGKKRAFWSYQFSLTNQNARFWNACGQ